MPGTPSFICQSRKRFQAGISMALPSSVKGVIVTAWLPRKFWTIIFSKQAIRAVLVDDLACPDVSTRC